MRKQFPRRSIRSTVAAVALAALFPLTALFSTLFTPAAAYAADHRDSPTADGAPEGDITDFFAFRDNNNGNLALILDVNPFSVPAETPSYSFSTSFLYQFKIDNVGDGSEDQVVQVVFKKASTAECPSGQGVFVYGPAAPPCRAR
jgi:hypothetical protein